MWVNVHGLYHYYVLPGFQELLSPAEAVFAGVIIAGDADPWPNGLLVADIWATTPGVRCFVTTLPGRPAPGLVQPLTVVPHLRDLRILGWDDYKSLRHRAYTALKQQDASPTPIGILADWFGDHDEPEAAEYCAKVHACIAESRVKPVKK